MNHRPLRTDLPVLLLYDLDPSWSKEDIEDRFSSIRELREAMVEVGHPVQEVCIQSADLETSLKGVNPDECLILNWCEDLPGVAHSEHLAAQILENMGFIFTGASAYTLALSYDKCKIKRLLQRKQILVPLWQDYTSVDDIHWSCFPAIVKPAFEHCSYGISRESVVQSLEELVSRVQYILDELDQPALVEEFIDSREFHVGVVGNDELRVLPPGEIDFSAFTDIHDRLCTYESNEDKTSLAYQLTLPKLPVDLTNDELVRLENIVLAAYRTIGCRDYARMDVRMRNSRFYMLDVNPNPDICSNTSLALGAKAASLPYGKLGSLFINLAAERHPVFGSLSRQRPPAKAGGL